MNWLRQIWNNLSARKKTFFDIPVDEQKEYLEKLPVPRDDIQRSYNQYFCQQFFIGSVKQFVFNVFALPFIIALFFKTNAQIIKKDIFHAVAILDGKDADIIPDMLHSEFSKWHYIYESNENGYLGKTGKSLFYELVKRYPFSWMFLLKCLIKIRIYNYIFETYSPKALVVCNEYSFTSSVLTKFCELSGVEHIDVMHGEKLYDITDSFFRYHRCFVWDSFYIKLFKSLRAEQKQFVVLIPSALKFASKGIIKKYDYIYYLGNEDKEDIYQIVSLLRKLEESGSVVAIRPHPRYTKVKDISAIANMVQINDYTEVNIEESIMSTNNVISLYSTVLNQAYNNGIGVVINDVTNKEKYNRLSELCYFMLSVPHKLLSECIENSSDIK